MWTWAILKYGFEPSDLFGIGGSRNVDLSPMKMWILPILVEVEDPWDIGNAVQIGHSFWHCRHVRNRHLCPNAPNCHAAMIHLYISTSMYRTRR